MAVVKRVGGVLVALVVACAACGGAPKITYDYTKEPGPRRLEYVIGIDDRLSIRVWKNSDLSADVVVRPDGVVTMPLIGDLQAAGLTPSELRDAVKRQLLNFIRDDSAVVTIAVTGINSYSFTVGGNVATPGVYSSTKYVTVLDAIQLAGGPNKFASPRRTTLFRQGKDGVLRSIPIDYELVQAGKRPEMNLALMRGDRVFVP